MSRLSSLLNLCGQFHFFIFFNFNSKPISINTSVKTQEWVYTLSKKQIFFSHYFGFFQQAKEDKKNKQMKTKYFVFCVIHRNIWKFMFHELKQQQKQEKKKPTKHIWMFAINLSTPFCFIGISFLKWSVCYLKITTFQLSSMRFSRQWFLHIDSLLWCSCDIYFLHSNMHKFVQIKRIRLAFFVFVNLFDFSIKWNRFWCHLIINISCCTVRMVVFAMHFKVRWI